MARHTDTGHTYSRTEFAHMRHMILTEGDYNLEFGRASVEEEEVAGGAHRTYN
jgi:hypothetical protein